jgi:GT2 family glycosyltransferase
MPEIAVVVVNWNGAHLLRTCLGSLRRQTFADFETILVDNGSTDDSLALVARELPEVRVVQLAENLGLAGGTNAGIGITDAPIIATLNNDTEADPRWLEALHEALITHPEAGSAASKLLLFDRRDVIHSAGDFYRLDGIPGNRGVWQRDNGAYARPELVFGACAGAAAYRREMLEDVGLFEDSFFMYCEDVDLAFRGQLLGYRCVYVPTAVVYHMLSATGAGPVASYYCGRNFLRVIARDMPGPLLRRVWPRVLLAQLRIAAESLWHVREPAARARLRGQLDGLRELPGLCSQRRAIQRRRRVPIRYLRSIMASP